MTEKLSSMAGLCRQAVGRQHPFHALDRTSRLHLAQHRTEVGGEVRILQHLDRLRADAVEQTHLLVGQADVHVQQLLQMQQIQWQWVLKNKPAPYSI
ncbi:hypothetical protein [Verminephrobacter eiseniae]|uniref:hypothetical protein n=1 Tax=Verminephrobacter eiseniae TaxID=364317 RepID=UPI0022384EC5|nr:hypothetical protein [Verminephrobacter eiseniae]